MQVMREAMTCLVCSEVYQASVREPVFLPCGHTFCRSCLVAVKGRGNLLCPTCRTSHNQVNVQQLSVNYTILSLTSSFSNAEYGTCGTHGDDLKYWCCECDAELCSLCLYSGHPQGHSVQLAKVYIQEKQAALEDEINLLFMKLDSLQEEEVKRILTKVLLGVGMVCRRSNFLDGLRVNLNQLLQQTRKATSIKFVKKAEDEVKESKEYFQKLSVKGLNSVMAGSSKDCLPKDKRVIEADSLKTSVEHKQKRAKTGKEVTEKNPVVPPNNTSKSNVQCVRLEYKESQLLLHCISLHSDTRLSLQVPSEVFLEVSAGGKRLGQVNIRLWCHLRRAHQFMALCLGTLGPSFLGTKADRVFNQGRPRECLAFKNYVTPNKERCNRPLITDLEPGPTNSKQITMGLVMQCNATDLEQGGAYSVNRTTFPVVYSASVSGSRHANDMNEFAFLICTSGDPGRSISCPFGEVVSGLEVVSAAVNHNPVTDVTITQCGLVLPDFVQ